ncbi:MAG TPA: phosphatase PAP2 family protein [Chitinophagaceae bacterium]|jgi:membrane-associated phospholipid phosphatase|nr:phosphatase PAP2 family protein [Chitinophagaceae bacterium]
MIKNITTAALALLLTIAVFGQDTTNSAQLTPPPPAMPVADSTQHYHVKAKLEIPLVVLGGAFTAYNFSRISKKTGSDPAYVQGLSKADVNWFDRWGVHAYDKAKDDASYLPFYAAMPAPLLLFVVDKKMRKDFFKLTFLYAEAMTATGVLYSSAAGYTNRLRPMVYSNGTPMEKRILSEQKKSFFAGHVALVATSTFFMARVIAEYHPQSRFKWLYYSVAGAATATTGYLRMAAGEHFLSDVLLGTAVGTLSGLLTPSLHKIKLVKSGKLAILPFANAGGTGGLTAIYRL